MQRSYNKYGITSFIYEVLIYCSIEELVSLEQYFLDFYQPEYNARKIAESNRGIKRSEEFKKRVSEVKLGITRTEDEKRKMSEGNKANIQNMLRLKFSGKPIYKICKQTLLPIKLYISMAEAARQNNMSKNAIASAARGVTKSSCGFLWKYKEDYDKQNNINNA